MSLTKGEYMERMLAIKQFSNQLIDYFAEQVAKLGANCLTLEFIRGSLAANRENAVMSELDRMASERNNNAI